MFPHVYGALRLAAATALVFFVSCSDSTAPAVAPKIGEDAAPTERAALEAGSGPRPDGVALCYTELSHNHPAREAFWDAMRGGDLDARAAAIDALDAATRAHPEEEELWLLLGLAHLWRVAEPLTLESLNPLGFLDAVAASEEALERAYAVCPTDHRLTAWLAPIKIRAGRSLGDDVRVREGFEILERGIEHYPGFVLFSKFLVYADLPPDDPEFLHAVEAVRENAGYCGSIQTGLSDDPACHNHPRASHNIEGASLFMGDMYAKAQDAESARAVYEAARKTPDFATWDYRALLQERIDTLDARVAAHATPLGIDDHETAWESAYQCSLCHRD